MPGAMQDFRLLPQCLCNQEAEDLDSHPVAALFCDLGNMALSLQALVPLSNATQPSRFQWVDVQDKPRSKQTWKVVPGAMSTDSAPSSPRCASPILGKMSSLYTMSGDLGTLLALGLAP